LKVELAAALDAWDLAKADVFATALARAGRRDELVTTIAPRAARSFANVGHGPIAAANCFRTLDVIGWGHCEPVVRSVVNGLLRLEHVAPADETGASEPPAWPKLALDAAALLARTPGLLAVHATTGVNALEWLSHACATPEGARFCRSQAAAWMPQWQRAFEGRTAARAVDFTLLTKHDAAAPAAAAPTQGRDAVAALDRLGDDRWATALAIVGDLRDEKRRTVFVDRARTLLVAKGEEAHDWKFLVALEESLALAGPELAAPLLANGVHYLRDGADADFGPVATARHALAN
jgi:hypothetical protein